MEISPKLLELAQRVEEKLSPLYRDIEKTAIANHNKVLKAFAEHKVSEFHFKGSTGYGYNDEGRDNLERVYASVLGSEAALVRSQIVSGTHAIVASLFGVLRPGDELLSVSGAPYDTLEEAIGIRGNAPGSMQEWGIAYKQVELTPQGDFDLAAIKEAINSKTRVAMIQRSRGYATRPSFTIDVLAKIISYLKGLKPDIIVFVDNCYGEMVETSEPTDVGADIIAGSLIKNMGGGLAPTGGYLAGKKIYIDQAANRLTAPGIGAEVGASLGVNRQLYQGLFLAPHIVSEALKGAVYTSALFQELGYLVSPNFDEKRGDIIQSIILGSPEQMVAFCRGLQEKSPVDAHVRPEPAPMPGYNDQVIMAGGTFIQGSSIELSADGPLREPYAIYLQGGLSKEYMKIAVLSAANKCLKLTNKL